MQSIEASPKSLFSFWHWLRRIPRFILFSWRYAWSEAETSSLSLPETKMDIERLNDETMGQFWYNLYQNCPIFKRRYNTSIRVSQYGGSDKGRECFGHNHLETILLFWNIINLLLFLLFIQLNNETSPMASSVLSSHLLIAVCWISCCARRVALYSLAGAHYLLLGC